MKKRYLLAGLLAILLVVALTAVACTNSEEPATSAAPTDSTAGSTGTTAAEQPATTPKIGGTLVVCQNIPTSVGYPAKMNSNADRNAAPICTDALLTFDKEGAPAPCLATSWEYSADNLVLTLHLREGVKFHDGTDFNADAVKTNLDLSLGAKRGEIACIASVEVVDNSTVKLNLSKVDAYLLAALAEIPGIMISPAALAKGEDWCKTNIVGTGPFKLVDYQTGVSARFEKFADYWQEGKPYLDAIEMTSIKEEMTAVAAFKNGDIQMWMTSDPSIAKNLEGIANQVFMPSNTFLVFDSANASSPFSDIKVRQAIAYAIDSQTLANAFGPGLWKGNNQLVDEASPYYNADVVGYPYSVDKAKELLAGSKYPNGFKADIIYGVVGNNQSVCTAIQAMLAEIGVELTPKPMDGAGVSELRVKGWTNGTSFEQAGTAPEKEPGRALATAIAANSGKFPCVARSAEYDALMDQLANEVDFTKRIELNKQLVKQMIDVDCMVDVLYEGGFVFSKTPKLHGDGRGEFWLNTWTPADAWLE